MKAPEILVVENRVFSGYLPMPASAGNSPHGQIKNPAASGKVIYVTRVGLSLPATGFVYFGLYDTDLVNLMLIGSKTNHNGTAAAGVAEMRHEQRGLLAGNIMARHLLLANTPWLVEFAKPVRLAVGKGFIVCSETQNQAANFNFTWHEEDR